MNNENTINLIFGRNPVKEALKANKVTKVFLLEGFRDDSLLLLISEKKLTPIYKKKKELDTMTDGSHQGVIAEIKPYNYVSLEEIIFKAKKSSHPIIIILDGINDPHNLGAILRSADIFGVDGIILPKHNSVGLSSTSAKTSAGAINFVDVCLVTNLVQTIDILKKEGFWVVSSDGTATQNYQDIKYDFPTVLVIGSEGNGISQLVLKNSDYIVKIPMRGKVNSLNASVAAGIFLSEMRRNDR